jgi:predicted pore-forming effector associated with SMODS systems
MKRLSVNVIAAIVVLVFAAGILLSGDRVQLKWLRFYSVAVLAATMLLATWDRYLWRLPLAQRFRHVPRNVRGTWKGTLELLWVDPTTGSPPPPKTVYLVVRQSVSQASATLLTDESRSHSSLAGVSTGDGSITFDYLYLNRPDSKYEDRSRMHHGSTTLDVTGRPPTRLRGRYWTDRDSKGQLDFVERRSALAEDFDQAAKLFVS